MTKSQSMPNLNVSQMPIQIGIDTRMIRHSGIGRYLDNLLREYQKESVSEFHYYLFGNPTLLNTYCQKDRFSIISYTAPIYGIEEQLFYPYKYFNQTALLHVPHYNIPIKYRGKLVITIHDMIHYHFPRSISNPLGRYYSKYLFCKAINHATRIITVSQSTKNDIIQYLRVPGEKIDVIYFGSPQGFSLSPDSIVSKSILSKYNIQKPYLLHVGIDKPHKNLERLIQAFGMFLEKTKLDYQLVLVGPKKNLSVTMRTNIHKYGLKSKIIFTDYIPDSELNVLYHNAELFIFPSLYEGFGLPPLEAMSAGIPVIVSNIPSLRETVGDSALSFDPYVTESIVNAILQVLSNPLIRLELIAKGKKRVAEYSCAQTAKQTLDVYRKVLNS